MAKNELRKRYFDWMCQLVCDNRQHKKSQYLELLLYLDRATFHYTIELDGNRAADGESLRYRFGRDRGYDDARIAYYLDDRPASILEVMIALAVRCEEHIMEDLEIGDRTGRWFWDMIESLGLEDMRTGSFDIRHVDMVIDRFLRREYKRTGEGGLFTIRHSKRDMRQLEIWYQMHAYLETIL